MSRVVSPSRVANVLGSLPTDFYREEFIRHLNYAQRMMPTS
jgi:hypothetical protein